MDSVTPNSQRNKIKDWLLAKDPDRSIPWQPLLEITLILAWTLFIGRNFLDFSPLEWPHGREYGMSIQPHYIWQNLLRCGACVMWNGAYNGGQPAFVELHAGVLHPLVILSTLIWGSINGSKVILIGSLAMAGLGQWWLLRVMGLGLLPRLWGAALVVAGGHLAARMEIGVISVILSTAACSLVIAPGLKLALYGRRRDTILLAIVLALAIVAGQGYLQLGLALSVLPAFAVFFVDEQRRLRPVWKEFLLAGGLALLLTSVFLIPLAHFWPQFGKDIDPLFMSAQPLANIPFNFVINNEGFYRSWELGKQPHPYLYMNYIGWLPILLALLPLYLLPQQNWDGEDGRLTRSQASKLLLFLCLGIVLTLFASSADTFRLMAYLVPEFAAGIRNPSLIQGLAVPLIVALAAWGLDLALKQKWPIRSLIPAYTTHKPQLTAVLTALLAVGLMALALQTAYKFSFRWLFVSHQENMVWTWVLESTITDDTQWVSLPFGEHFWGPLAADAGLKITKHVRPSHWRERKEPPPLISASRLDTSPTENETVLAQFGDIWVLERPSNHYAIVQDSEGKMIRPCTAQAQGGYITVRCEADQPGQLIVMENMWRGWRAWQDGKLIPLDKQSPWLMVEAAAGAHEYTFRYQPWDVSVGLFVSLLGLILAGVLWLRPS
ncbi:MAG: hypothetical protein GY796_10605 [Chloroflexi bacterium]|nr:hypothetical protein [Chloroflexota bacterium]